MFTAQRHVCICPADAHLCSTLRFFAVAEECLSAVHTVGTEGSHLFNAVGEGDEVQNFAEGFAVRVAVQTDDNYIFAVHVHGFHDELTQPREELCLFHNNEFRGLVFRVVHMAHEVRPVEARDFHVVVVDDHRRVAVAGVKTVANKKNGVANRPVAIHNTDDGRRLAGKHGANDEFQRHFPIV